MRQVISPRLGAKAPGSGEIKFRPLFQTKALPAVSQEDAIQRRAVRRIVTFFLLMLALTLFARGIAGAALSVVTVAQPQGKTVTEELEYTGSLESQSFQTITLPEGLTVKGILVTVGQQVKTGDSLVSVDTDTVEQAITQAQGELDKLELELEGYQESQETSARQVDAAKTSYQRAQEDYASNAAQQKRQVERAKEAVSSAQDKLTKAKNQLSSLREEKKGLEQSIASQKEALSALQAQSPEESPEDIEAQIEAIQEAIEENQNKLTELKGQITAAESEKEAAQELLDSAKDGLEDANAAASESNRAGKRSIEDAKSALEQAGDDYQDAQKEAETQNRQNQAEAEILSVSIQKKEAQLQALNQLKDEGGILKAPCDGTVSALTGEAGSSSENVQLQLTAQSSGYVLTLYVEEEAVAGEQGTGLKVGAAVHVTQGEQSGETTLAALTEQEDGGYTATAYLTGEGWKDGETEVQIVRSSGYYEMTVPLSAYHSDNQGGFLYVVQQQESVLGLQYVVRRESVTLLAQDGETAAVSGILSPDSQVVLSASRSIQEGERVRLEES